MANEDIYDDDGELLLTKAQLDAVHINDMALDDELNHAAGNLAYWNARYTNANRDFLISRHVQRILIAKLRLEIREEHIDDKPKLTADDITAHIHAHPDYERDHMSYVLAEADMLKFKKFAEAVAVKADQLRSIGAKLRAEMDGDHTVRVQHRENRKDRQRGD